MKTIYIVRHAKSEWEHSDQLEDIDRPLNPRGIRNAYEMSERINQKDILPDKMISSNGIRALHTAIIFAHQIGYKSKGIKIVEDLYHTSATEILKELKNVSNEINSVMLFAHNPGISEFASFVNKTNALHVPTCSILTIESKVNDWSEVSFETMTLLDFDFPKKGK